jgi:membrane associated rhomboid family serine protease
VAVFAAQEISLVAIGIDLPAGLGAKVNTAILAGQTWRLVTPLFLHGSLLHLFVNMYSLYALGPAIERLFGWRRMLTVYLVSGVAGVDLSLAFNRVDSLGASGAIFGLLGALGAFLFLHRASLGRSGEIHFRQIVLVALINLGIGLMPGIDNWAHLGGLAAGASLAFLLGPRFEVSFGEDGRIHLLDMRPWKRVGQRALWATAAVLIMAAAAAWIRAGA